VGLSPHMRGNPDNGDDQGKGRRSIPAHAGEPPRLARRAGGSEVYPRTCGGTSYMTAHKNWRVGLSPHMRGNPAAAALVDEVAGSIPAHAGEPPDVGRG